MTAPPSRSLLAIDRFLEPLEAASWSVILTYAIAQVLNWLYGIWPSYAGAIVLLTLIIMVLVTPLTLTLVSGAFPPEKRGAALGIWGGISGLGVALGALAPATGAWAQGSTPPPPAPQRPCPSPTSRRPPRCR